MKDYMKTSKKINHTLEPPILSKEELFEALVLRADYVFKADFIGYNYVERKALCQCLLGSLPRSLQEKLLAYTIILMGKNKLTCGEIAKILHEQGFLREKSLDYTARFIWLWIKGRHPLNKNFKHRWKIIRGDFEYIVGRMLGDGSGPNDETKRSKTLRLPSIDKDSINYASKILSEMNLRNKIYYCTTTGLYIASFHNIIMYWLLMKLRNSPEFAEEFGNFLRLSEDLAWRFIQGISDSEGSCSLNYNQFGDPAVNIDISNSKQHILELCKKCLEVNGIISHINKSENLGITSKHHVVLAAKKKIFLLERKRKKLEDLIELVYNQRV